MSRRTMLALSAALTAFVLVVVGAVATTSLRVASSTPAAPSPAVKVAETVPIELVRAREAELRRLVDEANTRLRAQAEAAASPDAIPASVAAPRRAEHGDDDSKRSRHGRHEGRLARNAHEEDDDG